MANPPGFLARAALRPGGPGHPQKIKTTGMDGAYFFFHDEILAFLTKDDSGSLLKRGALPWSVSSPAPVGP